MFNYFYDELYPAIGMAVSAVDGYVGTVVATQKYPLPIFTVFMESTQNFVDLKLYYIDRVNHEHIWLNVNKNSLDHINTQ